MAIYRDDSLFDEEMSLLRSNEIKILSNPSSYDRGRAQYLMDSIARLKEIIYLFRSGEGVDNKEQSFEYLKTRGELSQFVEKIDFVINHQTPMDILKSVAAQIESLYVEIIGSDKNETSLIESLKVEVEDLREKVGESQKDVSRARESANVAEREAQATRSAATEIAAGRISEEWANEYSQYINEDKNITDEIDYLTKLEKSILEGYSEMFRYFPAMYYFLRKKYVSKIKGVVSYSGHSYLNAVRHWRFWRSVYFFLLLCIASGYLVYLLTHPLPARNEIIDYLIQKIAFAPLVIVISLGFLFSSRNFRICANQLEDYKHKFVVAKTLQNLMALPETKHDDKGFSLLQKGTDALFAQKASGYMGKLGSEEGLTRSLMDQLNFKATKD